MVNVGKYIPYMDSMGNVTVVMFQLPMVFVTSLPPFVRQEKIEKTVLRSRRFHLETGGAPLILFR